MNLAEFPIGQLEAHYRNVGEDYRNVGEDYREDYRNVGEENTVMWGKSAPERVP